MNNSLADASIGRKNPRYRSDFYINKVVEDELHMARVRDISASGVFLYKLLEPQKENEEIGLEMVLPGSHEVIWAAGKVTREEERNGVEGVAVRFTRISEHHRQMISDFVEKRRIDTITRNLGLA